LIKKEIRPGGPGGISQPERLVLIMGDSALNRNDEFDADDGELVELPDTPATKFMPWHVECVVDGMIKSFGVDVGRDIGGKDCPELVVELCKSLDTHRDKGATSVHFDAGDEVTVTGGQTKLRRLMERYADKLQPGRRVVIQHLGLVKIADGKTMRDFRLFVDPATYASLGLEE
jgi:hypothetical protein